MKAPHRWDDDGVHGRARGWIRGCGRAGVAVAKACFAVLALCLLIAALGWTSGYVLEPGPYLERGITERDRVWLTLPIAVLLALGLWGLERLAARWAWPLPSLRRAAAYLVAAEALTWSFMTLQVPWADMQTTLYLGRSLARGDQVPLSSGYLQTYPFQIGLVAYFQVLATVFGDWTVYAVKILNAVYAALTVGVLARTADQLWRSPRVTRTFLFLAPVFLPLAMHSEQVYGDSPARLLGACAVLAAVRHLRDGRRRWLVAAWAALAVGCVLRTNLLIVALAIGLVLLARSMRTLTVVPLVAAVSLGLVTVPAQLVRAGYESHYRVDFGPGLPTSAWFAMGVSEGNHDAGWYHPALIDHWTVHGGDAAATDAHARRIISSRLATFREDPVYAGDFFRRKFVTQWADPDFEATRLATLQPPALDHPSALGYSMVYGPWHRRIWLFLDGVQSLIGALVVVWCAARLRRAGLARLLPAVVVLGGAMFHLLWEAKARYAFEYTPYLLLYAAAGLALAGSRLAAWRRLRARQTPAG